MSHGHILVVDDERQIGQLVQRSLTKAGHHVVFRDHPEDALRTLKDEPFEVIVTDLRMPGMDGLEFLTRAKKIRPSCEILMMTGYATVETALEAIKRGAIDYITKPFSVERDLAPLIAQILETPAGELASDEPSEPPTEGDDHPVAESPEMKGVLDKATRIAQAPSSVLLTGESGTGKDVVARWIHQQSPRRDKDLVSVNCAALPDTLLESELFGHTKGSFTGASEDRRGFFEVADGGTIFLDEIGEISSTFQPKLLRVLESGEFHRIGDAKKVIRVDVRVISATNRNLDSAVRSGQFREDLYYRLNVLPLEIPPLRERTEDIPALIERFLSARSSRHRLSPEALDLAKRYPWPGNVRELVNAVEHAVVLCDSDEIQVSDLPAAVQDFVANPVNLEESVTGGEGRTLEQIEVSCIMQAMEKTGDNRTQAARLLGISRRTLGYRIEKYELGPVLDSRRAGR